MRRELMNWEAIAAIAELLGALGVIASLVYLAGQVRSSANQARQTAIQSVVNQMNKVWLDVAADKGQADVWVRGSKGLSNLDDEKAWSSVLCVHAQCFQTI
jgi:hypothetical protein